MKYFSKNGDVCEFVYATTGWSSDQNLIMMTITRADRFVPAGYRGAEYVRKGGVQKGSVISEVWEGPLPSYAEEQELAEIAFAIL